MSERDELAKLLFATDNRRAQDLEREWELAGQFDCLEYVYAMADALIDAGYRKLESGEGE